MDKGEFIIGLERRSDHGDNRTRYASVMTTGTTYENSAFFDYGKSPLKEAKKFAKLHGYSTLRVITYVWNKPDKIYQL